MKILVVLTSHDRLGDTGEKTGFWLEELAAPYYVFKDAGADVTLASPAGGQPPLDPKSDDESAQTAATERFRQDDEANKQLAATLALSQVDAADFDAVFYPGGHGPLWDLATDTTSINLLEAFARADKPLALVCHAPGALVKVRDADGQPLVAGRRVTGFSNSEEDAVGLTEVVPFLLEDEFKRLGGLYEKGPDWEPLAVTDGYLVTGQNPASSKATATALLKLL
ncbi:type 1 glutamine amidotransferase domain-containing protein [Aliidiomarina soli]|uniref:Type 1 glutamine amidotransferase domain-containing protein n=1 Tax=Aliidiomarina soli TaxID=1928574 RepID=A0A432WIR7_9GAMM|nr:type 1 glutamine amidotransferase domain-containing protein [Aliidiomarina soli]RUO33658.1 type 1 glutamine amidotransferase domain-containing protein [Aliidiomarina soli]